MHKLNSVELMVKIFAKNDGFITHRKSNNEDLSIKYDYLYTLTHKVLSEAKTLLLKKKYDPSNYTHYLSMND